MPPFPLLVFQQEGGEVAEGDGQEANQQTHKEAADDQQEEQDEYWRQLAPHRCSAPIFNMWELLKDFHFFFFLMVHFFVLSKTEHMKQPLE